jgi:hypothetical protein
MAIRGHITGFQLGWESAVSHTCSAVVRPPEASLLGDGLFWALCLGADETPSVLLMIRDEQRLGDENPVWVNDMVDACEE